MRNYAEIVEIIVNSEKFKLINATIFGLARGYSNPGNVLHLVCDVAEFPNFGWEFTPRARGGVTPRRGGR